MEKKYSRSKRPIFKFKEGTIEQIIEDYFYKMQVELSEEDINSIVIELKGTPQDGVLNRLSELEGVYGADKDNYESDFLYDLMMDRKAAQALHINSSDGPGFTRGVNRFTLEGDYVDTFKSISDASQEVSGCRLKAVGGISSCASGKNRYSYGYIFEYVD